jgi:hypothetical protein
MSFPRPLNETEKAILIRVFEMTRVPELDVLREQVEAGIATRPWTAPVRASPWLLIKLGRARFRTRADSTWRSTTTRAAEMVWVDDGWLSNLETMWWSGDPPREFPPLDALQLTPPE